MCVYTLVCCGVYEGHRRTTCRSQFFSSIMWVLRIELRLPNLVINSFTCWTIFTASMQFLPVPSLFSSLFPESEWHKQIFYCRVVSTILPILLFGKSCCLSHEVRLSSLFFVFCSWAQLSTLCSGCNIFSSEVPTQLFFISFMFLLRQFLLWELLF